MKRARELIVKVEEEIVIEKLEVIDALQRLGISYHFQFKINQILTSLHRQKYYYYRNNNNNNIYHRDLYSTALEFRLLRQQGYTVSQGTITIINYALIG